MDTISAKELAIKWGISPTRVGMLAREGRIKGAKKVGQNWIFPADTTKPVDARCRPKSPSTPQSSSEQLDSELLIYNLTLDQLNVLLTDSSIEGQLCRAQRLTLEGKFEQAISIFEALEPHLNPSHRFLETNFLSLLYIFSNQPTKAHTTLAEFHTLLAEHFSDQPLAYLYLTSLESYYKGNKAFSKEFYLYSAQDIPPVAIPFASLLNCYAMALHSVLSPQDVTIASYELNCSLLEQRGYEYAATEMHCSLAVYYYNALKNQLAFAHIKRLVALAYHCHHYISIAIIYHYYTSAVDEALSEYPPAFCAEIRALTTRIYQLYSKFLNVYGQSQLFFNLTAEEHQLILYAIRNLSNSEIAEKTFCSKSTVHYHYQKLYSKVNVENKKELVNWFKKALCNYDD